MTIQFGAGHKPPVDLLAFSEGLYKDVADELARTLVTEARATKQFIPGLGHPNHKDGDPRTPRIYEIATETGTYDPGAAFDIVRWFAVPAAAMAAGYTGFLFGQAEGRDLWQSPLLFWHLQVQALMVGSGALAVGLPLVDVGADGERLVVRTLVLASVAHVLMLALEYGGRHATRHAAAAARLVTHGRYARTFWLAGVGTTAVAAAVAAVSWAGDLLVAALVAGLLVQVALLAYESVFVRAGQDVPLS